MTTPKNLNKLEIIDTATGKNIDITEHLNNWEDEGGFIPEGIPCPKCNGIGEYPGFSNEWVDCDRCGETGYIGYVNTKIDSLIAEVTELIKIVENKLSEEDISDMIENDSIGG